MTSDPHPPVLYEASRLILSCDVTKGSHLSYTWFFNRKEVTSSTLPLLRPTGNELVVKNVTTKHAGNYSCMASAMVKDNLRVSSSREVQVIVKGKQQQILIHRNNSTISNTAKTFIKTKVLDGIIPPRR